MTVLITLIRLIDTMVITVNKDEAETNDDSQDVSEEVVSSQDSGWRLEERDDQNGDRQS